MKKLTIGAILAIGLLDSAQAQNAPFCLVSNTGQQQCFYYSLDACRSAARTLGGMCAAQIQQQPQVQIQPIQQQPTPQLQHYNPAGEYWRNLSEAQQKAQQQRRDRERHEAEMRLIEAQTEQVQASTRLASQAPSAPEIAPQFDTGSRTFTVLYRCPTSDGGVWYTATPAVDCVVVAFYENP